MLGAVLAVNCICISGLTVFYWGQHVLHTGRDKASIETYEKFKYDTQQMSSFDLSPV